MIAEPSYLKRGLIHGGHSRAIVFAGVAFDVDLKGNWSHRRPEIVETDVLDGQPIGQVTSVGQGRRQSHHAHFVI